MFNSTWEIDFDSFNFEQAMTEILLELMENFKTCFVSEKIKCILSIDKQIHMELLLKSLRKDTEDAAPPSAIVFYYERDDIISSQSHFSKAWSKFSVEKSLSGYIKRCDSFLKPLELSTGFNTEMEKAYILLCKILNVLLSHEDALSEVLK